MARRRQRRQSWRPTPAWQRERPTTLGVPGFLGAPEGSSAPSSAQPAPLAAQGLPLDPSYWDQVGLNQLSLDQALADISNARLRVGQEYGFNAAGQLDTSNPYNRATLLQRSYQQGQRGTTNSMAARGQLYSGATQRNLDEGTFRYGRDYDTLRRGAADAYGTLSRNEQQAKFEKAQRDLEARNESLERAAANRPVDPGPPVPQRTPGGAPTGGLTPAQISQWQAGWDATRRRYARKRR